MMVRKILLYFMYTSHFDTLRLAIHFLGLKQDALDVPRRVALSKDPRAEELPRWQTLGHP